MTFEFHNGGADAVLLDHLAFDQRDRYSYQTEATTAPPHTSIVATSLTTMTQTGRQSLSPGATWLPLDMGGAVAGQAMIHSPNAGSAASSPEEFQVQSPSPQSSSSGSSPPQQQVSPFQTGPHPTQTHQLLTNWALQQHHQQAQQAQQQQPATTQDLSHFIRESALLAFNPFTNNFHSGSLDFLPTTSQAALATSLPPAFNSISPVDHNAPGMPWNMGVPNWQDVEAANMHFDGLPRMPSLESNSPTGTYLEVLSLGSSGSDSGWATVDVYQNYETYQQHAQQAQNTAVFNPSQTLHLRSNSDSSQSEGNSLELGGSYEEVSFPYSPFSPDSDTCADSSSNHRHCVQGENHQHAHEIISPSAAVSPIAIKPSASHRPMHASGSGSLSPQGTSIGRKPTPRRNTVPSKGTFFKGMKPPVRRTSTGKKDGVTEKRVGRRRGPLLPEQRKQASEIRKLRACLRCKFLKKTCDKGEPCAGCQPAHARLWQVPCTRIDIRDVGYFMKDWKADYERHLGRGVSVYNVKGFSQKESLMWITHGYGFCLPVMVREVYVAEESCFQLEWVESYLKDQEPIDFDIRTERLDVGHAGVSIEALNGYLDKHIDGAFEYFIDDHFEGTPFITEILKTAHRYYLREKSPAIRKALKLVLAYNLTLHITMVEQPTSDVNLEGQIDDEDSKYFGKVVAPVMINFQIKCAMADMWRDLQREVLTELSTLYTSVYSGERLKNWPTIFMLASILLAVWEEMQFDCHYRVPDPAAVEKFCNDMEETPVGVIVGLFHAISQKLPAFSEWDTQRHGQLLNQNPSICDAMTEVREHVLKHESYLRTRPETKFDRYDFDSLSNKFLSKLVIRAN